MPEIRLTGGDLDGIDMHYVEAGRGPATVLIHGLGGFAEAWRRTTAELGRAGRVIAIDLPGFGASSRPGGARDLDFFARAVRGFIDGLGLPRVHLVGHSLGGAVAMAGAALLPERVERVALLGACVPGFGFRPSLLFRALLLPGLGEILASCITPRLCYASVARCQVRPDAEEVAFFVGYRYTERTAPAARAAYLGAIRALRRDFTSGASAWRRVIRGVRHPVLLVHGRRDPVVRVAHAEQLAAALPNAETCFLDDCGHFPQVEHPVVVAERLADFLSARTGSR
jgi:pimeloyl-ACP methyl ester carboxylesterase